MKKNPKVEMPRIQQSFKRYGISGLGKFDVQNLVLFSETNQDMIPLHDILEAYFKFPGSDTKIKRECMASVHRLCYLQKDVAYARTFAKPPFLEMFQKNPIAVLSHLTLLYDEGHYQEVVDTHKSLKQVPNVAESAIVMAALYKIGTPEAFQEANKRFSRHEWAVAKVPEGKDIKTTLKEKHEAASLGSRGIQIFAYFSSFMYICNRRLKPTFDKHK